MSITEKYEEIKGGFWEFLDDNEDLHSYFKAHYKMTYEDGAYTSKTKHLMAMCGALASGCDGCILGQLAKAIDKGANKDEILEACAVAFSLGGTMAGSRISMVIRYMKENGVM